MTKQIMHANYYRSFSHFSNLAKNMRKLTFKTLFLGPLGKRNFDFYSVFFMFLCMSETTFIQTEIE